MEKCGDPWSQCVRLNDKISMYEVSPTYSRIGLNSEGETYMQLQWNLEILDRALSNWILLYFVRWLLDDYVRNVTQRIETAQSELSLRTSLDSNFSPSFS